MCRSKQTKKKVNLIYFVNAKVIRELIHVELSYFLTFDVVDTINNIVVRIKNLRYVLTKAINVRIFSLVILFGAQKMKRIASIFKNLKYKRF